MTLAQFVADHQGRFVDFDGRYGPQCVDLIDQYLVDVLRAPIVWVNGALDWYGKDAAFLDWTPCPGTTVPTPPRPGAVIVWHQDHYVGTGIYGHIAIVLSADAHGFISFDQNWPPGSPCHGQAHSYEGVSGWGQPRPQGGTMPEPMPPGWTPFEKLPAVLESIELAVTPDGALHLLGLGPDKAVYHATFIKPPAA